MSEVADPKAAKKAEQTVVSSNNLQEFVSKRVNPVQEPSKPVDAQKVDEDPEKEVESKGSENLKKRFGELTSQRKEALAKAAEAEKRALEAEKRAKELEAKANPPPPDDPGPEPDPKYFTDPIKFRDAVKKWVSDSKDAEYRKIEKQKESERANRLIVDNWNKQLKAAKDEIADFDAVTSSAKDLPVSDFMRSAMVESDMGPRLWYYFSQNQDEYKKIHDMSPAAALRAIGKVEAKIERAMAKEEVKDTPKPKAPEPIAPIRSSVASVEVPRDDRGAFKGTFEEYKAARRAGKIK